MRPLPHPATTTTATRRRKPHARPYCRRRSGRTPSSVKRFSLERERGAARGVCDSSTYATNCLPRRRMLHEATARHENYFLDFVVVVTKPWRARYSGRAIPPRRETSTTYGLYQGVVVEVLTRGLERDQVLLHRPREDIREPLERPALRMMDPHEWPVMAEQHDFLAADAEDL